MAVMGMASPPRNIGGGGVWLLTPAVRHVCVRPEFAALQIEKGCNTTELP